MLPLIRTSARIPHKPRLIAPIKRAPSRRVTTAVRHHAAHHHPFHAELFQPLAQRRI